MKVQTYSDFPMNGQDFWDKSRHVSSQIWVDVIVGDWFCIGGQFIRYLLFFICAVHSFIVASLRYLFIVHENKVIAFLQFNAMKMAHAPPGHHSVVGRPSVGGLAYPEYVVYRGEQVSDFTKRLLTQHFWQNFFWIFFSGLPRILDMLSNHEKWFFYWCCGYSKLRKD